MSCLASDEAIIANISSQSVPSVLAGTDAGAIAAIATVRLLERLVPRCALGLLLGELAKGRLMEGVRSAFLSTSTDLRRAIVALLVSLHQSTAATGAFARYAEAYLTQPQQKLLSIYIGKAAGK